MAAKQPKQNYLTINEQFKLIKVQQNEKLSQRKLADRFNCSKTQVQHILKRKQDVIDEYENSLSHKRKLVKVKLQCPKTDAYAYEWFQRAREFKIPISGPILNDDVETCRSYHTDWESELLNEHLPSAEVNVEEINDGQEADSDDVEHVDPPIVSYSEALSSLEKLNQFAQQSQLVELIDSVNNLYTGFSNKLVSKPTKQTLISDFFHKKQ